MPPEKDNGRGGGRWSWHRLKQAFSSRPATASAGSQEADALYERAQAAERARNYPEAVELYRAAVAARPGEAEFHYALGEALARMKEQRQAVPVFRAGLALKPDHVWMRIDLGAALHALGSYEEALVELEQARNLAPEIAEVHFNLAAVYHEFGRLDEAIAEFRLARDMAPDRADFYGALLLFLNCSAKHGLAEVFAEHKLFGARFVQPVAAPDPDPAWPRRLRIGYVSPDFRSHVVACFMLPILARHDRERFEIFCYYTFTVTDNVTEAVRELADHFAVCGGDSDAELAARVRADRIDILVDLAGHTISHRLKSFALRPAPVQVTYLGYPNTTGLSAIDYRLTDAKADPPGEADRICVERLVRLPRSFLCYRPGPDILDPGPPPAQGASRITFGSFNNFHKLSDPYFDAAARVLQAVPGSQLLLKAKPLGAQAVVRRVRDKFAAAGIDPSRLVLMGWETTPESHLAVYKKVDIALDSFPYNGTTTTCEAMWMGVPVITLRGDRHAGRVGASLLETVGLGDLVAGDVDEYVRIAQRLAGDLPRIVELRAGMRARLRASALMDERGFTRELEDCYLGMWQQKLAAAAAIRASTSAVAPLATAQALRQAGKLAEAKADCEAILQRLPANGDALELLWNLCHELGDNVAAVDAIGRALASAGPSAQLYYMLGCTMQDLSRTGEALAAFQKALELDPAHAKAANNLGCLQEAMGELDKAAESYGRALRADPRLANALYNRANLAKQRGQFDDAETDLRQALALEPERAEWLVSLAEIHMKRWRLDEAAAEQRAALALEPASARAHFGLGNALMMLGREDEAEASFRRAIDFQPDFVEAHSNLLLCLHYRKGDDAGALFGEHLAWARRHAEGLWARSGHPGITRVSGRRLNIGYVSPNFHRHSVASFLEPLLAAHDRTRFRIFCYSSVAHPDEVTERLKGLCDEWRDIHSVFGEDAARRIQEDRIDILVDLAGHTGGGRPLLFARKPAPVQIAWLGYPNTSGLAQMDYRLTDADADPQDEADRHYTEKLLRLSGGFLCFQPDAGSPEPGELPSHAAGRVTFGCFNNLAKVTPAMVALWSRLLATVPGSRLMMKAHALGSESARLSLLGQFAANGVAAERIVLLGPEDSAASHLGRYREVDIALDTYPYNGTTTTCEALWMGVPVVTLAGRAHVSRVGLSILKRLALGELVAENPEAYVMRAAALAADPARLRALREGLRARMRASPLLDAAGFARSVEAAYQTAWAAWLDAGSKKAASDGATASELRLHIGGRERKEGWQILNIQAGPDVDFVGNCTDLGQFADGSVQEVYASHVLEHLGYKEQLPHALSELCRVLGSGGRAMISVPDFEILCRLFLDPRAKMMDRYTVMRMAFGGQMDEHDFHYVGLNYEILSKYLFDAGFSRVERVKKLGLFHDDSRTEFLGEAISLNVVAYK
jgi:predicted O-linked N-acetylglucosamine transferase (SPINDLY family)/predicted SAM-dependent methyltransferase